MSTYSISIDSLFILAYFHSVHNFQLSYEEKNSALFKFIVKRCVNFKRYCRVAKKNFSNISKAGKIAKKNIEDGNNVLLVAYWTQSSVRFSIFITRHIHTIEKTKGDEML